LILENGRLLAISIVKPQVGHRSPYQISMLLWTDPDVPIAPLAQIPELLHFRMIELYIIFDWEFSWVKDPNIAPQPKQDA
jgi:hypothetical protein